MLQSMGLQRARHDWETEQQHQLHEKTSSCTLQCVQVLCVNCPSVKLLNQNKKERNNCPFSKQKWASTQAWLTQARNTHCPFFH